VVNSPSLNLTNFTIAAWVFVPNFNTECCYEVLTKGCDLNENYELLVYGANVVPGAVETAIRCSDGSRSGTSGSGIQNNCLLSISSSNWQFIASTYDVSSGYLRSYINGEPNCTDFLGYRTPQVNSFPLVFGYDNCVGRYLTGRLDDIAIYNRALTQEEITALYTGTPINDGGGNTSANPVPPGIPYQAVVRNANGQVAANAAVTTRFTLHQNTADGAVEYQETHALTTNAQGLMATVMGQGTAVENTFAAINWSNTTKFLQLEVDLGNGYVDLGTQQLMSVPYSIQSQTAFTLKNTGLPVYADNAAALAGGLTTGQLYRTSTGDLKIVY
jgi:hypothetical protein